MRLCRRRQNSTASSSSSARTPNQTVRRTLCALCATLASQPARWYTGADIGSLCAVSRRMWTQAETAVRIQSRASILITHGHRLPAFTTLLCRPRRRTPTHACGTGGNRGSANEHVPYSEWQSTYFTGCDAYAVGHVQFISVCDPRRPPLRSLKIIGRTRLKDGTRLIAPEEALQIAARGLEVHTRSGQLCSLTPALKGARPAARPSRPTPRPPRRILLPDHCASGRQADRHSARGRLVWNFPRCPLAGGCGSIADHRA